MKNRLKDFLAGVGSVLDINPDIEIKCKFDNFKISIDDYSGSDIDKIGGDFKIVGDDLKHSTESFSVKTEGGRVQFNFTIKTEEDYKRIDLAVRIANLLKANDIVHHSGGSKRLSIGPDGKIDWNDNKPEELKTP